MSIPKKVIGNTIQVTWVSSGQTPDPIIAAIYNGSDTLVNSAAMVDSGNGHFYHNYTLPNTTGFYVAETIATIGGNPYKNRITFQAVTGEVD